MFRTMADFEDSWKYESDAMQKVLDVLTDDSLKRSVADDHRSLGRIAWHIATTIPEMMKHTGLKVESLSEHDPVPATAKEIADKFRQASDELLSQIKENWNDDSFAQEDEMYGQRWARGKTLHGVIAHQAHHRGQMTVLMRQAGLPVPGVYGPSKEEWSAHGQEAPEI